ncbi:MAG: hypothetical protein K2P81_17435 [Bacteriovoracaceae bacterium]|nr:hypothetical protein [Bacteriovoracaceae bacterium]
MKTSLAGYNILLIEPLKFEAKRLEKDFIRLGANVFTALDIVQGLALQKRWDIDVILCNISFMTGLADVVSKEAVVNEGKGSPLLFAFGPNLSVHPSSMTSRGVLKFFSFPLDTSLISDGIAKFLFDPRVHLEHLAKDALQVPSITFVLQNGIKTWNLEVHEFTDEGLTAILDEENYGGDTGSMTVLVPGNDLKRFAVRVEKKTDDVNCFKLKVLMRDRDRWLALLSVLENKQSEINSFLLTSSGK